MSLALNMIVGSNESYELNRCLESAVLPGIFDEIVIVVTTHDQEVEKVARKFTDKVFYFEWIKDAGSIGYACLPKPWRKHGCATRYGKR